jgi:Mn2+/Fe2+ NRAMP family transporter
LGWTLNWVHFNAVKMLFWSAVVNGLLAPPLILLVLLLTSSRSVMGERVNSPLLQSLGWMALTVMVVAALGMVFTS